MEIDEAWNKAMRAVPLDDERVSHVIPFLAEGVWMHERKDGVLFALRLRGGGYLIGGDRIPSVVATKTGDLIDAAHAFLESLPK